MLRVRIATLDDAGPIASIHNEGIEERLATFETDLRNATDVRESLLRKGDRFPTIVAEQGGRVVGWASGSSYRSRPCYAGIAEHSVYVARDSRQSGVGLVVLEELLRVYEGLGFWKILSRLFPENVASIRLHERAGFRVVGVYRRHGRLDGRWRDCVIVEKLLGEGAADREGLLR